MERIIALLSNEQLLLSEGIDGYGEIFIVQNILELFEKQSSMESRYFLYYLEVGVLYLYKKIRATQEYTAYVEELRKILEVPISESAIQPLKKMLEEMQQEYFSLQDPEITIKFLR
ncbi:hypothetical protein CLV62_11914 [Dysgonomonas alginatilytica]|uniref:Uncharacterized protein n=1 Tax=Dysgonomonas alginatilytica TaxID=1605892 RepID=A0A2V3PP11_9BACT|nr:hypothetical protein [Dysgonomonas alginatilytica]PXV62474.1 hypothetical protein CLV62_11914 [Dysgonomonas alginatilytica]